MFVRYPRSVLRHELCHKDGNILATAKFCQTKQLGNNAGLGPPQAAAPPDDHLQASRGSVAAAQGSKRARTPCSTRQKGFSSQEVREKLATQGAWQTKVPRVSAEEVEPNSPSVSDTVSLSGEWEFPPARAGAPGRKAYRRGSVARIKGMGADPDEVNRALPNMKATSSPSLQWRL